MCKLSCALLFTYCLAKHKISAACECVYWLAIHSWRVAMHSPYGMHKDYAWQLSNFQISKYETSR